MSRQLADLLLKDKIISNQHFNECVEAVKQGAKSHIRFLIEKKALSENKLLYYLSQKFGLPSINLLKFEINPDVISLMSQEMVHKNQIIPIQSNNGILVVALCDPSYLPRLENVKYLTRMNVEPVLTSYSAFDATLARYYSSGTVSVGSAIENYKKEQAQSGISDELSSGLELVQVHEIDNEIGKAEDAPVIKLVNGILIEGIQRGASDIHLEPYEKRCRVRMRVDGVLADLTEIPMNMRRAVIARVKIMARMDIAESRIPQDGRIKLKFSGNEVDFRVNSIPTLFGEKLVLRILNSKNLNLDLKKLGFNPEQFKIFNQAIHAANGLVLVTGPTGSGKTTTLYSALTELNSGDNNLSTAEDPVEYNLDGVNQIQVHKEIGLTFPSILRSLLRQDPDIILVGEVRDYETAEVAIQAALTGHLVLSTLHTNDSTSTVTRLINMGIEPFLLVAALNAVVAQRLLRMICNQCKEPHSIETERLVALGLHQEKYSQFQLYRGRGCNRCNQTGYKGRVAIYEVLDFTQTLKEMVLSGENSIDIKKKAIADGMKTLRFAALSKAMEGVTSLEEAISLTMEA